MIYVLKEKASVAYEWIFLFVCLFCFYLLYVIISYLYSSIVEKSCHFLFNGCDLLAEMPYTFCAVLK